MKYDVILYRKENGRSPVEEFIFSLSEKYRAKVIQYIELLRDYGTDLREPYASSLNGPKYKGLWELRMIFSGESSRIIYFVNVKGSFVLLHGFRKKSMRTPVKHLDKALGYMKDHNRRISCE